MGQSTHPLSSDRGGSWLIRSAITSYSFLRSLRASASRNSAFRRPISVLVSSCAFTVPIENQIMQQGIEPTKLTDVSPHNLVFLCLSSFRKSHKLEFFHE